MIHEIILGSIAGLALGILLSPVAFSLGVRSAHRRVMRKWMK